MKTVFVAVVAMLYASLVPMSGPAGEQPASDLAQLVFTSPTNPLRRDLRGESITPDLLRGKLAVVSFLSAECGILCAVRTMDLDKLARSLPPALQGRIVFLAIDVNLSVEDPRGLGAFTRSLLGPDARLHVLPSSPEATAHLLNRLSYPVSTLPEPPGMVMVFDQQGRIAMSYGGDPLDVPRLQRDLGVLDSLTQGLGHPSRGGSDGTRLSL